jgi:hypothetical protein
MKTFLAVCSLAALSGCANPFLENYSGTRFPATEQVMILMEAPEGQSPIGRSAFIATQVLGDDEALAAAQEVGATAVVWSKSYLNSTTDLTTRVQPVTSNTTTTIVGDVNAQVTTTQTDYQYIPETRTNHWWEYKAVFFRMPK